MRAFVCLTLLPLLALLAVACSDDGSSSSRLKGEVQLLAWFPHADKAWTEGLQVVDGVLWESTGLEGESLVRALDKKGGVLWSYSNPDGFFNEGLVHAFGKTYLLTYKEGKAYLFDPNAEQPYTDFATYEGQGWGLTAVGDFLVNSNGSSRLYYRDPGTFAVIKEVEVDYDGQPVERLNELEFDGTYIWANQWQSRYIYAILESDPSRIVRFTLPEQTCPGGALNGIAWDGQEQLFYLTGQRCEAVWKARLQ